MEKLKIEIKILDLDEVKEAIKKADDRIKELESAMQEFIEGEENALSQSRLAQHAYDSSQIFKKLLEDK